MLDKAISIVSTAFEGEHDRGGHPYMLHCLHVMRRVEHLGTEAMIAGVMHDLLEDTKITAEDLLKEGFEKSTVSLIVLLTRSVDDEYMDYIMRISISPTARAIKMADLRHNSDIHRMKGLRPKDFERLKKYHEAYAFLKEVKDV